MFSIPFIVGTVVLSFCFWKFIELQNWNGALYTFTMFLLLLMLESVQRQMEEIGNVNC